MTKCIFLSLLLFSFTNISSFAVETSNVSPIAAVSEQPAPSNVQPPESLPGKKKGHAMMGMGKETPQNAEPISGTVLESMNNGGYSYIYLQKKNGDKIWLAVAESPVTIGSRMNFAPGIIMTDFKSKGLDRTFATIIFSDILTRAVSEHDADTTKKKSFPGGSKGSSATKEKKP
ncbi:MAG: hypothetical protein ACOYL3_13075 [Desulfuromonadaceae bacterium]